LSTCEMIAIIVAVPAAVVHYVFIHWVTHR